MNAGIPVRKNRWLLIAVTTLAVTQGQLGVIRAFAWFHAGAKLAGQGIPLMDVLAYGYGGLVLPLALLYFIFVMGTRHSTRLASLTTPPDSSSNYRHTGFH